MPVSFGNPALLFGTAAAALPVIIHFLSRRRVRRQSFSDLRFLGEVQARQARSLGLRRWLLLLLRVLALLLVALAAAAPRWGGLAAGGARAVLCIVDTSASMATQDASGTRLAAAVAVCDDLLASLPGGASVQVLTAGAGVEPVFADWLPAGAGVVTGLATVRQGYGTFDLEAALLVAAAQIERAPAATVEVVVISDLQDTGPLDPGAAVERLEAAGRVRVLVRQVGEEVVNGGVQDVQPPQRTLLAGERAVVRATVVPAGPGEVFTLEVDGVPVAEAVTDGPAGMPLAVTFAVAAPPPGLHRGLVRKGSDAFPLDDQRAFVLPVPAVIDVLLVHGEDRPADTAMGRGGWRALAAALDPGGGADLFRVVPVPVSGLTTAAADGAGLVVLVDPEPLGRQALAALADELDGGGAVLLVVGDPTRAAYLETALLPALGQPPSAVFRTEAVDAGVRGLVVDADHPVLDGLPDTALRGLEDLRWRRRFLVEAGSATVILATAAGEDPLLLTGQRGQGRWALLASHLGSDAGDLVGSPLAVPLLRRLGTWLARPPVLAAAAGVIVGENLALRPLEPRGAATFADPGALAVLGPEPGRRRTAGLAWRRGRPLLNAGTATAPGIATFVAGGDTVGLAASGLPAAETLSALRAPQAWGAEVKAAGLDYAGDLTAFAATEVTAAFTGAALAPWLFALAGLLLAVELWLGRGLPARPAADAG